jgi:dipeptidyl aminopeptidase/acylaminoacyl peptidase
MRRITVLMALPFAPVFALGNDGKNEPVPETVSFTKDVRPILNQHCQGCHQPAKAQGAYVLTDYGSLLKPGETGKTPVVPGKPADSYLIEEIRVRDGQHEMPKNRDALTTRQFAVIEKWIKQGAKDDTPAAAKTLAISQDKPPVYSAPPVVTSLAFDPAGKRLAVSGYHEILLFTADGASLQTRLVGLSERIQSLAFSPDGSRLAAVGGSPGRFGEVQIWDVAKSKLIVSAPVTADTLYGVSWAPDGSMVAFGCADNTVRGIDPATGKQTLQMGTHADWILGTTFSRDGRYLASVSRDMTVKLTEVATQRFIDNVTSITPGALKGGLMAVAVRPKTARWFQKVPEDTKGLPPKIYDELLVAGADGIPRLYKMHRETKRVIGDDANRIKEYAAMPGRTSAVAFDAAGQRFAAVSSLDGKGEVFVYDVSKDKVATCKDVSGPAYTTVWQPDGKVLVSAGFDGVVWRHDPVTGKLLSTFKAMPTTKVAAK